ncbi:LCP family protein [bacterium 210820-DFI.6.37]|nr:LCP family protein [bacterium 210820-DFI.6.37]
MQNQPNQNRKQNTIPELSGKKPVKKSRIFIIVGIIIIVAIFIAIIAFGIISRDKKEESKVEEPAVEEVIYGDEELGIDPTVDEQLKDYRNIALFGIDAKDFESETGHRSDGMIIVSINEKNDDVKMFSIYRDTYLKIDDNHDLDKVNHAYAYHGMTGSIKAINQNLDLNIREGISFTWEAVGDLVNNLGGVEVDVQESERVYMNKGLSSENQIASTGTQTLNGDQAVKYCRIRKDSNRGDYRRNERMQIVMQAAFEKAKAMDATKLIKIMDETLQETSTNMSRTRMADTLAEIASLDISYNTCWPYDTDGWTYQSIYYGVPITLTTNVSQLHEEFFGQKDYQPTEFVQEVSDRIESISGYSE